MSPRSSSATAHELARVGLLAALPGQTLAELGTAMEREQLAAGALVAQEGRVYVVLSGMLTAAGQGGAPRVLRPGDVFGPAAGAVAVAPEATVRALTPATVASCDARTFAALVDPSG